jgi:hypothetical protein
VRWPPACENVSPGAEERPLLSQLRVAIVRNKKLVAETGESSESHRKANVYVVSRYQVTDNKD